MNLRIGLCGSQGVGKSTLATLLSKEFGLYFITEIARKVKALGYSINENGNLISQLAILIEFLKEKRDHGANGFIADRTLIDWYAYSIFQRIDEMYLQLFEELMLLDVSRHDLIFYIPIKFPLQKDGVRSENLEYQQKIDEIICGIIDKHKLPVVEIKEVDVAKRLEFVSSCIREKSRA